MKKGKRVFLLIGLGLSVALIFSGCFLRTPAGGITGIYLHLEESWAKSVLPSVPGGLDVAEYIITGINNTNSDTLGPISVSGDTLLTDITSGNWDITAVARNGSGIPLAEGTDNIDVLIGVTAQATIVCVEYTDPAGTSFTVDLAYEPDILSNPGAVSYLKPFTGSSVDIPLTIDNVSCTLDGSYGPPVDHIGWWTYIVQLYELPEGSFNGTEQLAGGRASAVRLFSGYPTQMSGWLHLYASAGMIDLDLSSDLHEELALTPAAGSPDFSDLSSLGPPPNDESTWFVADIGSSPSFAVECAAETISYIIYENGAEVAVDVPYVMNTTGKTDGDYMVVDAVAFSVDGKRAGSESWIVRYSEFDPSEVLVRWIAEEGETYQVSAWEPAASPSNDLYMSPWITGVAGVMEHAFTAPEDPFILRVYKSSGSGLMEYWEETKPAADATILEAPFSEQGIFDFGEISFTYP